MIHLYCSTLHEANAAKNSVYLDIQKYHFPQPYSIFISPPATLTLRELQMDTYIQDLPHNGDSQLSNFYFQHNLCLLQPFNQHPSLLSNLLHLYQQHKDIFHPAQIFQLYAILLFYNPLYFTTLNIFTIFSFAFSFFRKQLY